mgnify:CR=1 FL=1
MASEIRVNKITHTAGVGTVTTNTHGIVVAGIITANSFSGITTSMISDYGNGLGGGGGSGWWNAGGGGGYIGGDSGDYRTNGGHGGSSRNNGNEILFEF